MLPTTGFFKNIDCPYYETTCDRPYCHFKHRKKNDEPVELAGPTEIPTYNPTPKSQLANVRSHIPITYVPDLAIRKEPHKPRSTPSYGYSDQQPTYKPTPLSILSTGKLTSTDVQKEAESESPTRCSPTTYEDDSAAANNFNLEDLQMEFSLIDEIIGESNVNDTVNDNKIKVKEDGKIKSKSSENKHSSSKLKEDKKKSNGHLNDSKNSKSHSSNNKSKSDHKKDSKSDHKHKKGDRKDRDEKHRKETKEKSRSESKKKSESKEKSQKHKSSSSSDKHKRQHSSTTKDKSKERDKSKRHKSKDVIKHEEKKAVEPEEVVVTKDSLHVDDDFDEQNEIHDDSYNNYLNDSDLEEDPMEECYKIFTEYKPTEPKMFPDLNQQLQSIPDTSDASSNRKRIAHDSAQNVRQNVIINKLKTMPSAAQVMANRFKMVRMQYEQKQDVVAEISRHLSKRSMEEPAENYNNKKQKLSNHVNTTKSASNERVSHVKLPSSSTSLVDDIISGGKSTNMKRKIAPVQNVNSIQREKAKLNEMARIRAQNIISKTTSQTIKHSKRVAHVPDVSVVDIPEVQETERSKLPINVRNNFLKLIFQECTKLYLSKDDARERAVSEEYKCYERCSAIVTYRNSAMLAISRLRKELQTRDTSGLGPIMPGECPDNKQNQDNLSGEKFYETIKRFILNNEELILHGFPREGSVRGRAVVKNQRRTSQVHVQEDERVCCRCSKHYRIDTEGFALYPEDCIYHPLKKRTLRGESIYLCCKSSYDMGCVTSCTHVSESRSSNDDELEGYQVIMPPECDNDPRSHQVFALDCEMCYTTKGLELTRVTIINTDCKTVYESLVKPLNPIIDYNTRFSGITQDQMERTATSILQVQANILHLCNSNTILIGHSLESDLKALKIIHSCIIDTSVLFPHKFGLPHKRALRDLAREYLKKIIQNDVSGHDSAEDALTCMELIKWKLKEDFKVRGIKVS